MSLSMTSWAILTFVWLIWFYKSFLALCKLKGCKTYVQFDILLIRSDSTQQEVFERFWKAPVKLANVYDLQPLSVNDIAFIVEELKVFCIIYIVTIWVINFSGNSKIIHNWKQKLIIWNEISLPLKLFLNFKFWYFWIAVYIHSSFFGLFVCTIQIFKFC